MIVPMDFDWHLLAGDATALPAMRRRLEELPASAKVIALAQLAEPADRRLLEDAAKPGAQLELHGSATPEAMLVQLRGISLPAGAGYA